MGTGILICGLNGAGKSTLGKALAEKLHFHFVDHEDLCFPKTDPNDPYASPRSREEVEALLLQEIRAHGDFVFASVRGDYGEAVRGCFRYAVLIEAPRAVRLQRVWERSFRKFGDRMLPGGGLYETEENFFRLASSRAGNFVEEWAKVLTCPIARVDGTKSTAENVDFIIKQIQ